MVDQKSMVVGWMDGCCGSSVGVQWVEEGWLVSFPTS